MEIRNISIETVSGILENPIEHLEAVNRWLIGEDDFTFGYYCQLDPANFPPAEQLTEEEMIIVIRAFEKMMLTWNNFLSLPKNFLSHLRRN